MIQNLRTIVSGGTVPHENIALEAYLLEHVKQGECILYLWQNRHTVVIGKNQNSWKECKTEVLKDNGGYLARRLSGGGAVFHDLGNLNFTFLVRKADYSVEKQTEVILQAVKMFGIQAERTGRNDIVIEGKKFSGNAFYQTGDCCYHHGTILIDVDKQAMSKYLNVSKEKLTSKGVDSVRSRVTNLVEYDPEITVETMKENLLLAFAKVYEGTVTVIPEEEVDWEEVGRMTETFSSFEWNYGRKIPFQYQLDRHYPWGEVQIQIEVNEGKIKAIVLYSDALDVGLIQQLEQILPGNLYKKDALTAAIEAVQVETEIQQQMKNDINTLLCESI